MATVRQAQTQESDQDKALRIAAEEESVGKAQDRAGRESARLFKLFGGRAAFGMSNPLGFSPMAK